MKKIIKLAVLIVIAVLTLIMSTFNAFAWDVDTSRFQIDCKNLPDETAFVDLLIPIKENDKYYSELNQNNATAMNVSDNCELSKYSDGYISLLLHNNKSIYNKNVSQISNGDYIYTINLDESISTMDIADYYKKIKVAYCDENGNILGVTNDVSLENKKYDFYNYRVYYGISVDCSKLTLEQLAVKLDVGNQPSWQGFANAIFISVVILAAVFIIIIVVIIKKIRLKKRIRSIMKESGDDETEKHK